MKGRRRRGKSGATRTKRTFFHHHSMSACLDLLLEGMKFFVKSRLLELKRSFIRRERKSVLRHLQRHLLQFTLGRKKMIVEIRDKGKIRSIEIDLFFYKTFFCLFESIELLRSEFKLLICLFDLKLRLFDVIFELFLFL